MMDQILPRDCVGTAVGMVTSLPIVEPGSGNVASANARDTSKSSVNEQEGSEQRRLELGRA